MAPPHHRHHDPQHEPHRDPQRVQRQHAQQAEDAPSFGAWLRQRRRALDLTQADLAERVGCARITIRRIEADELKPSQELAGLLAHHLGVSGAQQEAWLRFARGLDGQPLVVNHSTLSPTTDSPSPLPLPPFLQQPVPFDAQARLFVAREPELAQLQRWLDLACTGQGRVAFVTGEAGSGKSSLVQEFTRRAQQQYPACVVATGSCQAFAGIGDPYLPFRELLAMLTGDVETRWAVGAISRDHAITLWSLLPQVVSLLLADSPHLVETLIPGAPLLQRAQLAAPTGAPWVTQLATLVASQAMNAPRLQQQDLFAQTTRLLLGIARQRPLLLVLDDLQWADAGSLSLLFHLGRQLIGSRILLLGLYRPADVALGRLAFLSDQPAAGTERHPLMPIVAELQRTFGEPPIDLQQADGRTFIRALLASLPHRLNPSFPDTLYQHTEGQALFTVELLRALQTRGDLLQEDGGAWVEGPTLTWETLPARVEGIIGERIGRLPLPLQELLTIAAVEGETFSAEVIATVQGVSEAQVIQQLSSVLDKQHGLVRGQEVQRLPTGRLSHYRFRHHLFQTYLYQQLDAAERATLHEAVGQALVLRYSFPEKFCPTFSSAKMGQNFSGDLYGEQSAALAPQLARHFELAGQTDLAIDYLLQAGEQAQGVYLNTVAIDYFERALAQLANLSSVHEWHGQAATVPSRRFAALVGLGKAYYDASKLAAAEQYFRQALTIRHDPPLPAPVTARLYYWLAETLFWQHRYAEQLAAAETGRRLLGNDDQSTEAALLNYSLALSYRWLGEPAQANHLILHNAHFLAALPYSEELREPYLQVVQFYTRVQRTLTTARHWIATLQRQATASHDRRALARVTQLNGVEVLEYSGDLRGAVQEMRQAIHYFTEIGDDKYAMNCLSRLGWTLIRCGQLDAAETALLEASRKAEQLGKLHGFHWGYANWGLIQLCRGDWQAAAAKVAKTVALVQDTRKDGADWVWAHLLWARLHLLHGERAAARSRLDAVKALVDGADIAPLAEIDAPDLMRLFATLEEVYGSAVLLRYAAHHSQAETPLVPTVVRHFLTPAQPDLRLASGGADQLSAQTQVDGAWTWDDPFGDCRYTLAEEVTIWAANGRELYDHNRSAPRLLQPIQGDFVAQTRCCIAVDDRPAIGGLLLWRDEQNYLCLNQGLLGSAEISFRGALAGEPVLIGRGRLSVAGAYLRLERSESQVRALCSADGDTWFTAGEVEFPVADPLQIGLYAVGDIDRWFYPGAYPDGAAMRFVEFILHQRA